MIFYSLALLCACGPQDGNLGDLYVQAQNKYDAGKLDEAGRIFREIYEKEPGYANAAVMLARIDFYQKNFPAAIEYLEASLSHDDRNMNARLWLAKARHANGESAAALKIIDEFVALDSGNIHAWFVKGQIHESLGKLDLAIAAYKRSVDESRVLALSYSRLQAIYGKADVGSRSEWYAAEAERLLNQDRPR